MFSHYFYKVMLAIATVRLGWHCFICWRCKHPGVDLEWLGVTLCSKGCDAWLDSLLFRAKAEDDQ